MQLSAISGTYAPTIHSDTNGTFSSYHVVPSEYTKVVSFASNTDLPATGVNAVGSGFTSTYAAWISATQPAGTYTGKVKYILVHPSTEVPLQPVACVANYICYNPNGGNVLGSMANQFLYNSETLHPSNFSRQGYGFAGWSTTYDYSDPTGFYGPNEEITTPADAFTNGLPLYAIWVRSAGTIQNWSGCPSLATGSITALSDMRDNNTYAVAKLADGNCWMIENLRLDDTNSDNATGVLAQGYDGQFVGLATSEAGSLFNNDTTANSLYSTDGTDNTVNIGTTSASYRFPRYNNQNTASRASSTTTDQNIYSYGNYYTWAAAIANTDLFTTDNQSIASTSICPAGWHLPTSGGAYASGGTTGVNITGTPSTYREFYNLSYKIMDEVKTAYEDTPNGSNSAYSSNTTNLSGDTATKAFRKFPNNFVYSGTIYNGTLRDRGGIGTYWSSTVRNNSYAYYLYFIYNTVNPGTVIANKYDGHTVRCITSGT